MVLSVPNLSASSLNTEGRAWEFLCHYVKSRNISLPREDLEILTLSKMEVSLEDEWHPEDAVYTVYRVHIEESGVYQAGDIFVQNRRVRRQETRWRPPVVDGRVDVPRSLRALATFQHRVEGAVLL